MQPKLRAVQPNSIEYDGNPYILLHDPLSLTEMTILVPQSMGMLLALLDGTRDLPSLRVAFELRTGILLDAETLERVISGLDDALLSKSGLGVSKPFLFSDKNQITLSYADTIHSGHLSVSSQEHS